jgi:hypothetical protein
MSRYFNDFGAMSGESLEHGFGEKAHKYIDKVKTKSGKWRYIYKKKTGEAIDKLYERDLPKDFKKTVKGDTAHYEYKDKAGNDVTRDVIGRGLSRTTFEFNSKDVEVGPAKKAKKKKSRRFNGKAHMDELLIDDLGPDSKYPNFRKAVMHPDGDIYLYDKRYDIGRKAKRVKLSPGSGLTKAGNELSPSGHGKLAKANAELDRQYAREDQAKKKKKKKRAK